MAASITIRIDDATKQEASEVAKRYGFDLSSITRAFWRQVASTKKIPLTLDYADEPNDESLRAIRETEAMVASGSGRAYDSAHELLEAAMA